MSLSFDIQTQVDEYLSKFNLAPSKLDSLREDYMRKFKQLISRFPKYSLDRVIFAYEGRIDLDKKGWIDSLASHPVVLFMDPGEKKFSFQETGDGKPGKPYLTINTPSTFLTSDRRSTVYFSYGGHAIVFYNMEVEPFGDNISETTDRLEEIFSEASEIKLSVARYSDRRIWEDIPNTSEAANNIAFHLTSSRL